MAETVSMKSVRKVVVALSMLLLLAGCSGGGTKGGSPGPGPVDASELGAPEDVAALGSATNPWPG